MPWAERDRMSLRQELVHLVVALANKNARMAVALIQKDQPYDVTKMCGAA
jgi:hypothetical protein